MFDCNQPDDYCLREVIVHVASYHHNRDAGFNERNPGLGLRVQKPGSRVSFLGGGYRNSIRRDSLYAGVAYDLIEAGPFYARVDLVAVTGYDIIVAAAPLPEFGVRFGGYGIAVNYVPPMQLGGFKVSGVAGFSLTKEF